MIILSMAKTAALYSGAVRTAIMGNALFIKKIKYKNHYLK